MQTLIGGRIEHSLTKITKGPRLVLQTKKPRKSNSKNVDRTVAYGAPEEIRTPDPQIRSLVRTVEIIEVRYRKKLVGRGNARVLKLTQLRLLPKDFHEQWLSQMR